ncbi:MAG TPA: hypothetical protein VM536_10725, partial [Chloroflexia bacterium]|nr:hypothetical protein [Chloroflexia bacterium]
KVEDGCKVRLGGTATRVQAQAAGGCCGSHNGHGSGSHNGHGNGTHDQASRDLSWGGPGRIRTVPQLSWQDTWPQESTGKIVLAQVELDAGCAVRRIHTGVRKYVGVAEGSKVQSFALEGEKDVDKDNPKQLHFHIRGGRPGSVALYLRAAKFSTLYYTEMGQHAHNLSIQLEPAAAIPAHSHTLGEIKVSGGDHSHTVTANTEDTDSDHNAIELDSSDSNNTDLVDQVELRIGGGGHEHTVGAGQKTDVVPGIPAHTHTVTASSTSAGITPPARSGSAHTYVADLKVWIDNQEYTAAILAQLGWTSLGDGSASHALVTQGTGPIQLDLLGADLSPGDHLIEFKVGAGGGRVLYNLYVE